MSSIVQGIDAGPENQMAEKAITAALITPKTAGDGIT